MTTKDRACEVLSVQGGVLSPPDDVYQVITVEPPLVPDFEVWKQTPYDDHLMKLYLAKGYSAPREVTVEYQVGRPFVTPLFSNGQNSQLVKTNRLDKLNDILSSAQLKRRDFNKVKAQVGYKPPPRMTLTENKRDIWLKRLSDPKIPLNQLSRAIPHGLRNKVLLEQCLIHRVPITRTIWLIKCVSSNEQRQLHRKAGSNMNIIINKWIIEWTEQVTAFLEGVIASCFNTENGKQEKWIQGLNFACELIVNIYAEGLINRVTFLTWIVRYLSNMVKNKKVSIQNLKFISVHYLFLHKFWFKIIKIDYLAKELGEAMLYLVISMEEIPKNPSYDQLVSDFHLKFQYLIRYLFYYNSDAFIIPSGWNILKSHLKKILDIHLPIVNDQYNLILYRNESLMVDNAEKSMATLTKGKPPFVCIPGDQTSLIVAKLNNFKNEPIEELVKLIFEDISIKQATNWKDHLSVILRWAIQNSVLPEADGDYSSSRIALIVTLLRTRHNQLTKSKTKKSKQLKTDLEVIITEFVNNMSEILNYKNIPTLQGRGYSLNGFLLLITKLNDYKIFIISSYLRKLIASGVIYLSKADRTCFIHLLILNTITELRIGNSKNIFKRLSASTDISLPDQDSQFETLRSNTLLFWDKISSEIEIIGDTSKALYDFRALWPWKQDHDDQILYTSLKHRVSTFFVGLIRTGKIDTIDTGVSTFKLSNTRLAALLEIGIELDVVEEILESLILGIDSSIFKVVNEKQNVQFEIEHKIIPSILKLVIYYEKLLRSTLSFFSTERTKWHVIAETLHRWANNGDQMKICEWGLLIDESPNFGTLFENPRALMHPLELVELLNIIVSEKELNSIGFNSYERLFSTTEFGQHVNNGLVAYINFIKGVETQNYIAIVRFLQFLKSWKPEEFETNLVTYITRYFNPTLVLDYEMNRKIFTKMISDGLLEISKFIDIFGQQSGVVITENSANGSYLQNGYDNLVFDVLFGNYDDQVVYLDMEKFRLRFQCWRYSMDHPESYCKFVFDAIYSQFNRTQSAQDNSDSLLGVQVNTDSLLGVPVIDGPEVSVTHSLGESPAMSARVSVQDNVNGNVLDSFPELASVSMHQPAQSSVKDIDTNSSLQQLSKNIVGGFWTLINRHLDLFVKFFYENHNDICDNKALRSYFMKNILLSDELSWNEEISAIVKNLSYFNLPLYQWVFRSLIMEVVSNNECNGVENKFVDLILNLMEIVKSSKTCKFNSVGIVGELFACLPDKIKIEILLSCEEVYLTSDAFPSFLIHGENMTEYLKNIISSCSRFEFDEHTVELTDALVFSLNMSIEKLSYYCHGIDHPKIPHYGNRADKIDALTKGIKMISKIIMLHKKFLVDLIIKRSVNLQKDVLLMNLTKLYNNRIMTKNPKLKNLLYDVLISLKILITESIIQEQQKQLLSQGNQQQNLPNTHPIWLNKGTPTSIISSVASPKFGLFSSSAPTSTMYVNIPNILNIRPPNFNNSLKHLLTHFDMKDTVEENDKRFYIVNEKLDRTLNGEDAITRFTYKAFEMIEDTNINVSIMDTPISLSLFDCSFDRKNPP